MTVGLGAFLTTPHRVCAPGAFTNFRKASRRSSEPRDRTPRLCRAQPITDKEDPVKSNLFGTKWPWEFIAKKPGTQANASNPHLLMTTKLAHYFTLVAQGEVTWTMLQVRNHLVNIHHFTDVAVFVLALGSVYQAMAGAFFIMAHEYDGWQIAHCKWPDAKSTPNPAQFDNDRLRLVAYQMLFWFQGLGMGMGAVAVLMGALNSGAGVISGTVASMGWTAHAPKLLASMWPGAGLGFMLVAFYVLTPWFPTMYARPDKKALLVPRNTVLGFIILATLYGVALFTVIKWWAILVVALFTVGGLTEGLISESTFDQFSHLIAVVLISFGCFTLIYALTAAAGVPALWWNEEVRRFMAVLGVAAVTLIKNAVQETDKQL